MILTSSKGKHNSKWLSSKEIYPLTQLLTLETVQSPGLVGQFILSAAPATVGFILQLIPSALQDDCELVKTVFPFSPEKSHGQRNLAGYSPKGCKESDKTERLSTQTGKRERQFTSMKYRHSFSSDQRRVRAQQIVVERNTPISLFLSPFSLQVMCSMNSFSIFWSRGNLGFFSHRSFTLETRYTRSRKSSFTRTMKKVPGRRLSRPRCSPTPKLPLSLCSYSRDSFFIWPTFIEYWLCLRP